MASKADRVRLCCYLESTEMGGMEFSAATLLANLDERYQVTLLGVSNHILTSIAQNRPGTVVRVVPRVAHKSNIAAIVAQIRAVRDLKPDLLMVNLGQLYDAQYGILAGLLNRVPTVAVAHCVLPPVARSQALQFRVLARGLRALAGVSHSVASGVERELGLEPGAVSVLYNGVADAVGPAAELTSDSAGDSVDGLVLGSVGRLSPEKGYDLLFRAMVELPECRLVVLGEGPERPALTELALELGIADRIEMPGWVEPPWPSHYRFDLLIAPSRFEGFGLVAVEAMLAGIPVVASRLGGFEEIISDGQIGVLVEPENPSALVDAVRALMADPARRRALSKRGRDSVLERFTPSAMASAYDAFVSRAALPAAPRSTRWRPFGN